MTKRRLFKISQIEGLSSSSSSLESQDEGESDSPHSAKRSKHFVIDLSDDEDGLEEISSPYVEKNVPFRSKYFMQGKNEKSDEDFNDIMRSRKVNVSTTRNDAKAVRKARSEKSLNEDSIFKKILINIAGSDEELPDESDSSDDIVELEFEHHFEDKDGPYEIEKLLAIRKSDSGYQEVLVKLSGRPYKDCDWYPEEEVRPLISNSAWSNFLRRAKTPKEHFDPENEIYFNPEYLIPESIIWMKSSKNGRSFLVKWKGLPHTECSWETEEFLSEHGNMVESYTSSLQHKKAPSIRNTKLVKLNESPEYKNGNKLRAYQVQGVNWLNACWHAGRSSILADEMGLGKTIQVSAFLHHLKYHQSIHGPFLIIAPLSTIHNWHREISQWTDFISIVYHGDAKSCSVQEKYEMRNPLTQQLRADIIVTSYQMVNSSRFLQSIGWESLIIDEAQAIKNHCSSLHRACSSLSFEHCILMTGTPVQNNIDELWSLLHFMEPEQYFDLERFKMEIGDLEDVKNLEKLHRLLKPYMLRRIKADVEKELAPKEETVIEVAMTCVQKKYYRGVYEQNVSRLLQGKKSKISLLNIWMQIRKICNHPFSIEQIENLEIPENASEEEAMELTIKASSKTILLDKLLVKLKQEGHKVLIFSQFKLVLDILEDMMNFRGYNYERVDGSINGKERQRSIDRFQDSSSDGFVFLLTTRAGGVGITLTAADTVILFDSDWNPQLDLQAQARCHRIGQTKPVKIYRLVCKNSYEQQMFQSASRKLGLDRAILSPMEVDAKNSKEKTEPDRDELEKLLKFGAYHALNNSDDNDAAILDEDIESILSKSTKREINDNEKGGGAFSKASFVFNENGTEIDIDDPLFWSKLGILEEKENSYLDRSSRRSRKKAPSEGFLHDNRIPNVQDNDDDKDYVDEEEEADLESDDSVESPDDFARWTKEQREYLLDHILRFGFERSDKIDQTVFEGKALTEIENYCLDIFCGFASHLSLSPSEPILNELWPSLENRVPETSESLLGSSRSSHVLALYEKADSSLLTQAMRTRFKEISSKKYLRNWVDWIRLTRFFKQVNEGAISIDAIWECFSSSSSAPCENWNNECDLRLLRTLYSEGYSLSFDFVLKFPEIKDSSDLSDLSHSKFSKVHRRFKELSKSIVKLLKRIAISKNKVTKSVNSDKKGSGPHLVKTNFKETFAFTAAHLEVIIGAIMIFPMSNISDRAYLEWLRTLTGFEEMDSRVFSSLVCSLFDGLSRCSLDDNQTFFKLTIPKTEFSSEIHVNFPIDKMRLYQNRKTLLLQLRSLVSHGDIDSQLCKVNLPLLVEEFQLPAWWNKHTYTSSLMKSVASKGFGYYRKGMGLPSANELGDPYPDFPSDETIEKLIIKLVSSIGCIPSPPFVGKENEPSQSESIAGVSSNSQSPENPDNNLPPLKNTDILPQTQSASLKQSSLLKFFSQSP